MISIIYPTLNEESVIGRTLQSLKSRLGITHEIIVSDGKSTDRTVEIARKYADKVVEYKDVKRQTIAQGRNDGAKAAQGEFVVFLDADTYIERPNEFFTRALSHFEKDPNLVALTVRIRVLPEFETWPDRIIFGSYSFNLWLLNNVFHTGESMGEFQMIRKTAFDKVHGFREDLVTREDGDMFMRLAKVGRTLYDSKLVIFHSGRRAHNVGWVKLLWTWTVNTIWFHLFNRAKDKEWTVVR